MDAAAATAAAAAAADAEDTAGWIGVGRARVGCDLPRMSSIRNDDDEDDIVVGADVEDVGGVELDVDVDVVDGDVRW